MTEFIKARVSDIGAYRPMRDQLLLRRYPPAKESEGGVILPDASIEFETVAWVVRKGPDSKRDEIAVGCTVTFNPFGGQDIPTKIGEEIQGKREYFLISEDDVLAVIDGPAA